MPREYAYRKTITLNCKEHDTAVTRIKTTRVPNKDTILIPVGSQNGGKSLVVYLKSKRVYLKDRRS